MINNDIFNIFCFSTFSLWYFLDPVFRAFFLKFSQNAGFVCKPVREAEQKSVSDLRNFRFGFLSDLYNEQKM